jgi:hypothetical protein
MVSAKKENQGAENDRGVSSPEKVLLLAVEKVQKELVEQKGLTGEILDLAIAIYAKRFERLKNIREHFGYLPTNHSEIMAYLTEGEDKLLLDDERDAVSGDMRQFYQPYIYSLDPRSATIAVLEKMLAAVTASTDKIPESEEEAVLRHFGELGTTLEATAALLQHDVADDLRERQAALAQMSEIQDAIQKKIDEANAWLSRRAG